MPVPIICLAPVALKGLMPELVATFEATTGLSVGVTYMLNPEVPQRIMDGADYDIALTNPPYVPVLIASGRAAADSHQPFGRVPLALAAQAGHRAQVCETAEGIADLLTAADSIAFTAEGTSGRIFRDMARQVGVLDAIAGRLMPMAAGEPIRAVAHGDCTLAAAPLTTVLATEGVIPAAICPSELGTDIDMSVFLSPDAAGMAGPSSFVAHLVDTALDDRLAGRGIRRFAFDPGAAALQ
jgi:hypothetical protein